MKRLKSKTLKKEERRLSSKNMSKLSIHKLTICVVFQILFVFFITAEVFAAGEQKRVKKHHWSFAGIFGHYDDAQLQRGFQVYREVCSSCHSMNYVYYRNLAEEGGPGFTVEEVKAGGCSSVPSAAGAAASILALFGIMARRRED